MGRYQTTLILLGGAIVIGAIMFAIVGTAVTFKAGLSVGGTFWATGAFLGLTALPERQRRGKSVGAE